MNPSPAHHPLRRDCHPHEQVPATSMLPLWRRVHQELMIRGQKWGLPTNVAMVLVHLHLHPEDSEPAAVAAANYFPRQTITFILDQLEREGLAVRKPHPNDRRRKLVVSGLNSIGLKTFEPRGAFYAFPDLRSTGLSDEEFCNRLLKEESVAVVPGNSFGDAGIGFARVSYATSYEKIEEALVRIDRFVKRIE